MATEQIILDIRAQVEDAKRKLNELEGSVSGVNKQVTQSNQLFQKAAGAMAGLFSVGAIVGFTKRVIEVRQEFEKYEAVLSNTLGSQIKANLQMERLSKFASQTPFQLNELTAAYVKLVNQGFKPTTDALRRLGDLASSTGKSFDQLTEAIIDATVGEFERLKEFGIRAKKSGDTVKFTFKEVETQVKFTRSAIEDYILSLGDLQGVSGSMEKISETLGGRISNLRDEFDLLFNSLGEANSGVLKDTVGLLGQIVRSVRGAVDVKTAAGGTRGVIGGAARGAGIADFFVTLFGGKGISGQLQDIIDEELDKEEIEKAIQEQSEKIKQISEKEFKKLLQSIRFAGGEELEEGSAIERWMFGFDFDATNDRIQNQFKEVADGLAEQRDIANREADNARLEQLSKTKKETEIEVELARFLKDQKLQFATEVFSTGSQLAKEGTDLQKILKLAEVTISAISATQKAYEWGVETGGPVVGAAAAAAAAVVGALNIALVAGVTFGEGGFTGKSKLPQQARDRHGRIAGLVHEDEFVFTKEKTAALRPLFEDIHSGRIDARGLAALTKRGVILPLIKNEFNSAILEREVGKIYQRMREEKPVRMTIETPTGYKKIVGNTTINIRK